MPKKQRQRFTSIGHALFDWEPLLECSGTARWVWLSCYAGSDAKLSLPGLFRGDLYAMTSASRFTYNDTYNALHELITAKLVTFDHRNRILRYLHLPDALDRAHTFQAIHGWFTKFCAFPACPQRDAHIPLLKWMIDQGEKNDKMAAAWRDTFGTIPIPVDQPIFGSPSDSDTGTRVQPSLFGPRVPASNDSNYSNPTGHPSPLGSFPEPDQDQVSDLGEEEDDDPPRGTTSASGAIGGPIKRHLQLVPDPPGDQPALDAPPARTTELTSDPTPEERAQADRAEYAAEMRRAHQEAARALGDPVLMS